MIEVLSVRNMRESDAFTIKNEVSSRELMYRAGKAVYSVVDWKTPVAIVCGAGNNAGDGYVIASLFADSGKQCEIFLTSDKLSEDGKYYLDIAVSKGIPIKELDDETDFSRYSTVVDCIFGTGFKGKPSGKQLTAIQKINDSGAYVVSVDINSGLSGDGGTGDVCVISDLTVSIGAFKSGHFLGRAKDVIRKKVNCDIGIKQIYPPYSLIEEQDVVKAFPQRLNDSNKGTYGYTAIIGGSMRYGGAAKLANSAAVAMCSGTGVVKLAVPRCISAAVAPYLLESTLFPLSDDGDCIVFDGSQIDELVKGTKAVAVGMGICNTKETQKLVGYLLENYAGTLILDADALNALATVGADKLKGAKAHTVITPHLKEFSRLSGLDMEEIKQNPVQCAVDFAKEYNTVVLLKGATTVITDGERVFLCDRGCAGMATAGSGDVLSGILVAMCGYASDMTLSCAAAAYINGLAGELAQKEWGATAMTASDTVANVKKAVSFLSKKTM